ncbi:Nucleolar protein 58 [Blastocladiella emersonii ATCC 22665]|nr:Nucleolar protein 58 [Blastocladiella emersonii ATCC 22665]
MVLVLFETPAGYALFRVLDDSKLAKPDEIQNHFASAELAAKNVKLAAFAKFENTADALSAATALVESKISKSLKKMLQKEIVDAKVTDTLAICDVKLASEVSKKLGINVMPVNATVNELFRGIRSQLEALIQGLPARDMSNMALGLSHSLSRYMLKFSPDKVDTMIVQAVGLLDDLDKELNTYAMRVKEWYGWHFPEMAKIIVDNVAYAKVVATMGFRTAASTANLAAVLPEELEQEIREAAEISMGTEISDEDLFNIRALCDQVIHLHTYRTQLFSYLGARMNAIAPNLTALVGELVGARLIAHAGSLMTLAKHPASTIQILGAEKALFRALKTKKDTPKYGLLFHAGVVGQASGKNKGKVARVLATKAALSIRVDALSEDATPSSQLGIEARAAVEKRLRDLEARGTGRVSGAGFNKKQTKYEKPAAAQRAYNPASDFTKPAAAAAPAANKRKHEEVEPATPEEATAEEAAPAAKKAKSEKPKKEKSEKPKKEKSEKKAKKSSKE